MVVFYKNPLIILMISVLLLPSILLVIIGGIFLAKFLPSTQPETNVEMEPSSIEIPTKTEITQATTTTTTATTTLKEKPAPLPPKKPAAPIAAKTETTTEIFLTDRNGERSVLPATSTLSVSPVPLLSGGIVHVGTSVPISYLKVVNTGREHVVLTGFWIKQNGSAPVESIIGLSTIDDRGGSQNFVGGIEGKTPFDGKSALAPTNAKFAPGQIRLFTIKAHLTANVSAYIGKNLMIDVTGVETNVLVKGVLPIRGTTWTISN